MWWKKGYASALYVFNILLFVDLSGNSAFVITCESSEGASIMNQILDLLQNVASYLNCITAMAHFRYTARAN